MAHIHDIYIRIHCIYIIAIHCFPRWITLAAGYAGGLTQFQLIEDSAPATQTQKAVTDAITKSTLSMIGYTYLAPVLP